MTAELAIFISITALLFNVMSVWVMARLHREQQEIVNRVFHRINYLEVGMSFHDLIPMPWEMEDFEDHYDKVKSFKQEGNVVYLQNEE